MGGRGISYYLAGPALRNTLLSGKPLQFLKCHSFKLRFRIHLAD